MATRAGTVHPVPAFAVPARALFRFPADGLVFPQSCRVFPGRKLRATLVTATPMRWSIGVPNLRDVGEAVPRLQARRGALLRGSAPAICTDEARPFLSDVSRFIDLRSRDERTADPPDRIRDLCGEDFDERVHAEPLLNRRRVIMGLAKILPREQVKGLVHLTLRSPRRARKAIVQRVDDGGLYLLNRIILEAGGRAIARALKVITASLREQQLQSETSLIALASRPKLLNGGSLSSPASGVWTPSSLSIPSSLSTAESGSIRSTSSSLYSKSVYIYCSAGKDRTGLLVALILGLLGASEDEIVRDYVKSAETWENGPYSLRAEYSRKLEHNGLTPKTWLIATPDIMERTLWYLNSRYGSVEQYLTNAGFSEQHQEELRQALL